MNTADIIAITQPLIVDPVTNQNMTPAEFVAYTARVSNPSNQMNNETAPKLLKYLIKNNHWSPFEMVSVCMQIVTTRDIARQILRHRSFSFQEFSQRYADPTKELGWALRDARLQDNKNRQNSFETDDGELIDDWDVAQDHVMQQAIRTYRWAIENGIAKEQARAVLPEGLILSRLYMTGTLRSWIHYCQLRRANGTQLEHRTIAEEAFKGLSQHFPFLTEI